MTEETITVEWNNLIEAIKQLNLPNVSSYNYISILIEEVTIEIIKSDFFNNWRIKFYTPINTEENEESLQVISAEITSDDVNIYYSGDFYSNFRIHAIEINKELCSSSLKTVEFINSILDALAEGGILNLYKFIINKFLK
jgi:hypothetical protein